MRRSTALVLTLGLLFFSGCQKVIRGELVVIADPSASRRSPNELHDPPDAHTIRAIFLSNRVWKSVAENLSRKGIPLSDPTVWRDRHIRIDLSKRRFDLESGEMAFEVQFRNTEHAAATSVLPEIARAYEDYLTQQEKDPTRKRLSYIENQITAMESEIERLGPPSLRAEVMRENVIALRKNLAERSKDESTPARVIFLKSARIL